MSLEADGMIAVRLKDSGTTFYDMIQQRGVVADRVSVMEPTDRVNNAIREGQLVKLSENEYQVAISEGRVTHLIEEKLEQERKEANATVNVSVVSKRPDPVQDSPATEATETETEGETEATTTAQTTTDRPAPPKPRGR